MITILIQPYRVDYTKTAYMFRISMHVSPKAIAVVVHLSLRVYLQNTCIATAVEPCFEVTVWVLRHGIKNGKTNHWLKLSRHYQSSRLQAIQQV